MAGGDLFQVLNGGHHFGLAHVKDFLRSRVPRRERRAVILVGVDSDDQLNTTTTFMTDDSCHFYLPEDCAPAR